MRPIGSELMSEFANEESRIGPNKRDPRMDSVASLERIIIENTPLEPTWDVRAIQPPFFSEFVYHDLLGGIALTTLSAEINARVAEEVAKETSNKEFPIGEVFDKYKLTENPFAGCKKVVFMTGSNSIHMVDQQKLLKLLEDEEWVVKPHPVTNEDTLREMARVVGYHRMVDPNVSGMQMLEGAEEIATLANSELYLVARLTGKPVVDLTRHDRYWLATYSHITRLLTGSDKDKQIITNILMSDHSGYLRPHYSDMRNLELVRNYSELAMSERERFRMISSQSLNVVEKGFPNWN